MGKGLVIGLIVLVILVIGGYFTYNAFFTDSCKNLSNAQSEKDNCYADLAVEKQKVSLCEKIEFEGYIYDCYIDLAVDKGDSSICTKIDQNDFHRWDICHKEVATKINDVSLCEEIIDENSMGDCYMEIAIQTNNIALCEKANVKEFCEGKFA